LRQPVRFAYAQQTLSFAGADSLPFLPIQVEFQSQIVSVSALVDSGASNNVLPYSVGMQLGFVWEQQPEIGYLAGNLAQTAARAVVVQVTVGVFEPVLLAFAWTQNDAVPVILGQVNFFAEFDVCFFRSEAAFEVTPKQSR
jgi:hypothetical protein